MLSTVLFCAWTDITNAAHSNIDMTVFFIVVKMFWLRLQNYEEKSKKQKDFSLRLIFIVVRY
jgi:uncharacterized membrane protein YwzB